MRIAVYAASEKQLEQLKSRLARCDAEKCLGQMGCCIDYYYHGMEDVTLPENSGYQIIFLAKELPGDEAVRLASLVRGENPETVVVLGLEQLYLDFCRAFKIYKELYCSYSVIQNQRTLMIPWDEILFMESSEHKIKVHTVRGPVSISSKLDWEAKKVPSWKFVRIHQSYLVNLSYVSSLNGKELLLNGEHVLKISSSRRAAVQKAIREYSDWLSCI